MQITRRFVIKAAAATSIVPATGVFAGEGEVVEVQMLNANPDNKKQRMVFLPRVIKVNVGDTVVFKSVDKGHNSEVIKGMFPEDGNEWKGKISKDTEVTFEKPGIYGYKCTPHATVGMVGMVIVEGEGKLDNLEAAKSVKQRGKAKGVFNEIWEEAEAAGYLNPPEA